MDLVRADYRFNSNTFGINPKEDILPIQTDSGIIPETHPDYLVFNIGKTQVYAELKYGTKVMWHGITDTATIKPGEKKILRNWGKSYYVTGLKVYNKTSTRAVVHCATEKDHYFLFVDKEPGIFDEVKNKLLKEIFALGVKYVPYVGSALSGLVKAFWPDNKPNAWEQVKDKVKLLVDQKILDAIGGILDGDIRYYKERITVLISEIDSNVKANASVHYMNIAQDLIGLEIKFTFGSNHPNQHDVNKYLLPLYSMVVLMKITYYVIGIQRADQIGLSDKNLLDIKSYATRTIHGDSGANKYITAMYQERVDNAYKTSYAEDLYDCMMNERTYIASHGLEYIAIWNNMLDNPSQDRVYNDVISYSQFYGRQTPNLIKEAIPRELSEPLTPQMIKGKRNKVVTVEVYIWRINNGTGDARIGGMKVVFKNGTSYTMGTVSGEVKKVDFKEALLTKLEVYGGGALDLLTFHFSDGRSVTCGTTRNESHTAYELKDHHIVSIFLASDNYSLGGQAANISVAYQLNYIS